MWLLHEAMMSGALLLSGPLLDPGAAGPLATDLQQDAAGSWEAVAEAGAGAGAGADAVAGAGAGADAGAGAGAGADADGDEGPALDSSPVEDPLPVVAGALNFHIDRAIAVGTGCPNRAADVLFEAVPGGFSARFKAARVQLPMGSPVLAALRNCSIRMPIEIQPGYRIAGVTQRLRYTVTKSPGSRGSGSSLLTFVGAATLPLTASVPFGSFMWGKQVRLERVDTIGPVAGGCGGATLLALNMAFTAQKTAAQEYILMSMDRIEVREGAEIRTERC